MRTLNSACRRFILIPAAFILAVHSPGSGPVAAGEDMPGENYLTAVRKFADNALEHGRDVYGSKHTPLFVDGVDVDTFEPVRWRVKDEEWVLANLASQQNLFRVLDGLSELSGNAEYRQAAVEAVRWGFDNLQHANGLLFWGGHTSYDAAADRVVSESNQHELKSHCPYYLLMWQVDPKATRRFIEALWAAHIRDWSNLDFNRHGDYERKVGKLWENEYVGGPVFFRSKGLTFINTGSDLFHAAAMLHKFDGQEGPLMWANRLAHRYVQTRNPKTGMGGYQFSQYHWPLDLAQRQFGPEFGDRIKASTLLDYSHANGKYARGHTCQMITGECLGASGHDLLTWALEDIEAYARHAYDPADNMLVSVVTDGTRLSPSDVKRAGYYGPVQSPKFRPVAAGAGFFRTYALAYCLSGKTFFWETARSIGRGIGLGDLGLQAGVDPVVDLTSSCSDPAVLIGLLELHRKAPHPGYLKLAERIGDNILAQRYVRGLFVDGSNRRFTRLDRHEPLALLHLVAALRGEQDCVPRYWPNQAYFACYWADGGRKYDAEVIYGQPRNLSGGDANE